MLGPALDVPGLFPSVGGTVFLVCLGSARDFEGVGLLAPSCDDFGERLDDFGVCARFVDVVFGGVLFVTRFERVMSSAVVDSELKFVDSAKGTKV